jgi:hypothetical protein
MLAEFLDCFCLQSHTQLWYDKMEATTGFRMSNRSRNHLDRLSNGRVNWSYGGKRRLSSDTSDAPSGYDVPS